MEELVPKQNIYTVIWMYFGLIKNEKEVDEINSSLSMPICLIEKFPSCRNLAVWLLQSCMVAVSLWQACFIPTQLSCYMVDKEETWDS